MELQDEYLLVAAFMGYYPSQFQPETVWEIREKGKIKNIKQFQIYANDWKEIMPVVAKIEELPFMRSIVTIKQGSCKIESGMLGDRSVYAHVDHYFEKGVNGKKSATFEAIVQFIKLYNKALKNNTYENT